MRALLVVNPNATSTSPRVIDVIVRALSHELDLEVTMTTHKGHAQSIGEYAVESEIPLVITLGGDGVVNEVINGIMYANPLKPRPAVAPIPGGSGNVFVRALGLPIDPVEATGAIMESCRANRFRNISLGLAQATRIDGEEFGRYFAANSGIGLDATIIAAMDKDRKDGVNASPIRYLSTTLREYFRRTNRTASITVTRPGSAPIDHVYVALVQNTSPWTYFGSWALDPNPAASFDTGLDAFIVRKLDPISTALAARRIIARSRSKSSVSAYKSWHDQRAFSIHARVEVPIQIDGEALGNVSGVQFTHVPEALRVINPL
ncbi:MAG: diacylglycerol kinase family protein [Candidatus Nanopelagicales bacterium]|nr:diacylglycerol kinase family lipid kinase [Actinomycetes bacterium]